MTPLDFPLTYVRPMSVDHLRMSEGYDHADAVRERIEEQRARERRERIVTWLCLSAALFAAVVFALQFIVRSSGL